MENNNQYIIAAENLLTALSNQSQSVIKQNLARFYKSQKDKDALVTNISPELLSRRYQDLRSLTTSMTTTGCDLKEHSQASDIAGQIYDMLVIQLPHTVSEKIPHDEYKEICMRTLDEVNYAPALTRKLPPIKPENISVSKVLNSRAQNYLLRFQFDNEFVLLDKDGNLIDASDSRLVEIAGKLFLEKYNMLYIHNSKYTVIDLYDIAIDKSPEVAELADYLGQKTPEKERQL